MRVLGPDGAELADGVVGNIAIKLPLPPGSLMGLWKNEEGYKKAYLERYPGSFIRPVWLGTYALPCCCSSSSPHCLCSYAGFYDTSDAGYKDEDGYFYVMSRTDDVMNVAVSVTSSFPQFLPCSVCVMLFDLTHKAGHTRT